MSGSRDQLSRLLVAERDRVAARFAALARTGELLGDWAWRRHPIASVVGVAGAAAATVALATRASSSQAQAQRGGRVGAAALGLVRAMGLRVIVSALDGAGTPSNPRPPTP